MQKFARIAAAGLFSISLPAAALAQDAKDQPPADQTTKDQAPKPDAMKPDAPAPDAAKPDVVKPAEPAPVPPEAAVQPVASVPGSPNLQVATVKMEGGIRASKIIGASVTGANNQDLGTINDLVLDKDGKIVLGVVSVGSVLGMGGKLVAEPYGQFQMGANGKLGLPNVNKDELAKQPGFTYADQ